MKKYIIHNNGFIGDILFSSSIAARLKKEGKASEVYYVIRFIQPSDLLLNNPYIDGVFVNSTPDGQASLDKFLLKNLDCVHVHLPLIDQSSPATEQYQRAAGVTNVRLGFDVYTIPLFDYIAHELISKKRKERPAVPVIGWQVNWEYKAYQCTDDTLRHGIGAPHRNIEQIIKELEMDFIMMPLGFDRHVENHNPIAFDSHKFNLTASIIKHCDWVIGSEGGITNLAAAVRTKTIITTDYIMQNYGPNGRVRQIMNPTMGPFIYYPHDGHVNLDPCIRDEDIVPKIKELVHV